MPYKKKIALNVLSEDISSDAVKTVNRIDSNDDVIGVLFLKHNLMKICTVPENMAQVLIAKLPALTDHFRQSLGEINVLDELIAFRIESTTREVLVAPVEDRIACVLMKNKRKLRKRK